MWFVGMTILIFASAFLTAIVGRKPEGTLAPQPWDLDSLAAAYALIVGPLAGLSVASLIFLANLSASRPTQPLADVMGMFLFAFLILVGTALMFATTRSVAKDDAPSRVLQATPRVMYILSNVGFYAGLTVGWVGLRPLLTYLKLHTLGEVFTWVLLFAIIAGAARLASWLYALLTVPPLACGAIPLIGIAAPAIYRLVLVPLLPTLWPSSNTVLLVGILLFVLVTLALAFETVMISLRGAEVVETVLRRFASSLLPPYVQAVVLSAGLLWFAILMP